MEASLGERRGNAPRPPLRRVCGVLGHSLMVSVRLHHLFGVF